MAKYECGFCGGDVVINADPRKTFRYMHADAGDRVKRGGPGDFVSDVHNRAGTPVNPADVVEVMVWNDHADDSGNYCTRSGERVEDDDDRCPAGCRASEPVERGSDDN